MQPEMPSSDHGNGHVMVKRGLVCFYAPQNFGLAPTFGITVPLAIADLLQSESVIAVYGSSAVDVFCDNFFLIANYPVQKLKVFGKIVGEQYRLIDNGPKDHVIVTIDDCLGTQLSINVKISKALYDSCGLVLDKCYGIVIEVAGILTHIYDMAPRIDAHYVGILGNPDDLDAEIRCWKAILEFREQVLEKPWVCNLARRERFAVGSFQADETTTSGVGNGKGGKSIGREEHERGTVGSKNYNRPPAPAMPLREGSISHTSFATIVLDDSDDDCTSNEELWPNDPGNNAPTIQVQRQPSREKSRGALSRLSCTSAPHITTNDKPLHFPRNEANNVPELGDSHNSRQSNTHEYIDTAQNDSDLSTLVQNAETTSKPIPGSKHTFSQSDRIIIDFMSQNSDAGPDQSLEIIEPVDPQAVVPITTKYQLFLAYLFYIIGNGEICEFSIIRKDPRITCLLDNLVRHRMAKFGISPHREQDERLGVIYGCENELLREKYRLVDGNSLQNACDFANVVRNALHTATGSSGVLNVISSLEAFSRQNSWLNSPLSIYVKVFNAICEWTLSVERNDRQNWHYHPPNKSWSSTN